MPPTHRCARRGSRAALCLGVAVLGISILLPVGPTGAQSLQDAEAEIAALRKAAAEASQAYLDTLAQAAALEAQIAEIEARLPELEAKREALKERALERAVEAYTRAGSGVASSILTTSDVLTLMRRNHLLDELNAQDHRAFANLAKVSEKLEAQRAQLQQARAEQQVVLEQLQAQGRDIDAKLQAAEDRAAALRAVPPRSVNPVGTGGAPPSAPVDYTPTPGSHPAHAHPTLICIRRRESDRGDVNRNGLHDGGYGAYNPAGPYMGAYQFLQSTWNSTANRAGRPELIGVPPHTASVYDQDDMAWVLSNHGTYTGPWGGTC